MQSERQEAWLGYPDCICSAGKNCFAKIGNN